MCMIKDNETVLFIGDSITDAGRIYENLEDMGRGYPLFVDSWFSALYPDKNVKFTNRGISGHRVKDLQSRWQKDCIDLQPDWVSILIGINDCWRRYDNNDPTDVEKFKEGYKDLLTQVKEKLEANIIMLEPFLLPVPEDRKAWREDLDPKIHAVRELAREFEALYIPLDGIFAQASAARSPEFWLPDGVHPSSAGHALIANTWLKAVKAI